ncbi:MAG TPA: tRNA (adenosine(37)-N6)-dimethylallyltransferase MiaA [Candidatus Saccharimonadales bacterium]|nr:tRNA (adenosine(37)-N6)-dimethylallyltransferase MiaA [Candidatus Saccharimonadales bacterium]
MGPTASGKSALAMRIAQAHNGEIIASDSRTIYRGMDIGTAKPTAEDQRLVPHHLIDVRNPDEPFSAAEFKLLAQRAIDDIVSRGKLPIMVGGTGLYVDAVIFDYQFGAAADEAKRAELNAMTIEELQQLCREKNIAMPINSQNKRHLVRAIELGGLVSHKKKLRDSTFVVGISTERDILRERVRARAKEMVSEGVIDEVEAIGHKYEWRGEALKGNIYRIFRGVVEGTKPVDDAIEEFVQSDMALAKRQMTWFKRNASIHWSSNPEELEVLVDTFLNRSFR